MNHENRDIYMNRKTVILLTIMTILIMGVLVWLFSRPAPSAPIDASTTVPPVMTTTTLPTDNLNISVTQPSQNDTIQSPLTINGQARVFENTVNYELTDANGVVLVNGFTTAFSPDVGEYGPYTVTITYPKPTTATGTLRVFNYSARDGLRENVVTVPVQFMQ